jgi:hypothetical protein
MGHDPVWEVFQGRCPFCGIELTRGTYHVAHIHPKCDGGKIDLGNYVYACNTCNISMSGMNALLWCKLKNIETGWIVERLKAVVLLYGTEEAKQSIHQTLVPKKKGVDIEHCELPTSVYTNHQIVISVTKETAEHLYAIGRYLAQEWGGDMVRKNKYNMSKIVWYALRELAKRISEV